MSCKKKTFWFLNWLLNLSLSRFGAAEKRLITVRDVYCMFNWVSSQWDLTYWTLYEQENRYQARLFEGWRMSDAIHSKNLYTKDIVVRFVNIYPVDSDLAVGQLYLFYGQLGPDGWGETTIPSTLPSTIKTTYLQSSIIKKCPNSPPLPPYWNHLWVRRDHATWQNSAVCFLPLRTPQNQ